MTKIIYKCTHSFFKLQIALMMTSSSTLFSWITLYECYEYLYFQSIPPSMTVMTIVLSIDIQVWILWQLNFPSTFKYKCYDSCTFHQYPSMNVLGTTISINIQVWMLWELYVPFIHKYECFGNCTFHWHPNMNGMTIAPFHLSQIKWTSLSRTSGNDENYRRYVCKFQ